MSKFKNELGRLDVLSSQFMANKLSEADNVDVRDEIVELLSEQPFSVKRSVATVLQANVAEVVLKNLTDRAKQLKRRKR